VLATPEISSVVLLEIELYLFPIIAETCELNSPEALARLKKIKEILAQKSKFIRASEFAGNGKTIEVLDVDTEVDGKFGPTVQLKVKEPKSNNERIWPVTSVRALREVSPLLDKGTTLMHVWTTGTGVDTMYNVKEVGGNSKQHDHRYQKQPNEKNSRVAKKQEGSTKKRK
jgi:hypothetical protein